MSASRVTRTSLVALSQLFLQKQDLGLYFKAISRLNRQLYQTLLLHVGAAVTTLFLWGKAVHKALEGACESWKQRIFSLRLPRTTDVPKICLPLENMANPSCWQASLVWVLPLNILFYSQLCCLYWFCSRCTKCYHYSIRKFKERIFSSVPVICVYTFLSLFLSHMNEWKQYKTPTLVTKQHH